HAHAVELGAADAPADPEIAIDVAAHTVGIAALPVNEHAAVGQLRSILDHIEHADQTIGVAARLRDVDRALVGREADAVRAIEVGRHHGALSGRAVDAIDVGGQFRLGLVADVVAADAVGRIGEPDRAIGFHRHIVGRVEPLAVVAIADHRNAAVVPGAGDAA